MSIRTERVAAVLQRDLGKIIQKSYQPTGSFITVTHVDISPDLLNSNVYVSVYAPGRDEKAIYDRLTNQIVEIRKELASKIKDQFRRVPELNFKKDTSAKHAQKMEELFDEIEEERKSRNSGDK
ncbi:MAG TPA: 30S ribosome-binding factor RbfA [Balneolaceae bacterium]|nr:30S ribosome-binding factor RbfA [Balneolaceae bacterium]